MAASGGPASLRAGRVRTGFSTKTTGRLNGGLLFLVESGGLEPSTFRV